MAIHYNRQKGVNNKIIFLYSLNSWSGECVSYKQSEESSGNVAFPSSTVSKVVWCGLFLALGLFVTWKKEPCILAHRCAKKNESKFSWNSGFALIKNWLLYMTKSWGNKQNNKNVYVGFRAKTHTQKLMLSQWMGKNECLAKGNPTSRKCRKSAQIVKPGKAEN